MKEIRATLPAKVTIIISEHSESGEVVIEPRNSDISFKPSDYNIDASLMQVPQSPATRYDLPEPKEAPQLFTTYFNSQIMPIGKIIDEESIKGTNISEDSKVLEEL